MYAPVEVVPVEPVALKVVSLEAMVHGWATPETVANACRLDGHADRKHDRQCGERHEGRLFWT